MVFVANSQVYFHQISLIWLHLIIVIVKRRRVPSFETQCILNYNHKFCDQQICGILSQRPICSLWQYTTVDCCKCEKHTSHIHSCSLLILLVYACGYWFSSQRFGDMLVLIDPISEFYKWWNCCAVKRPFSCLCCKGIDGIVCRAVWDVV